MDLADIPESSRRIAAVFDRAAGTYDAVGIPWFQPIADRLVAEVGAGAGERALDVGRAGAEPHSFPLPGPLDQPGK